MMQNKERTIVMFNDKRRIVFIAIKTIFFILLLSLCDSIFQYIGQFVQTIYAIDQMSTSNYRMIEYQYVRSMKDVFAVIVAIILFANDIVYYINKLIKGEKEDEEIN